MIDISKNIRPKGCILLLTLECIFRCKMCHLWNVKDDNLCRPSIEQWKHFISSFDGFVEKGTSDKKFTVTFGGGEPLLRKQELLELSKFCSQRAFWSSIASNGYLFSKEVIEKLVESKLHYLGLSLDSTKEETHDYLRGMKGSYKKVMETIEYLSEFKERPFLAINTIIMAQNLNDILELTQWAVNKERISSISFQAVMQPFHDPLSEGWYKQKEYGMFWPNDTEKINFVIDMLIGIKKEDRRNKISNSISQLEAFRNYFIQPEEFLKKVTCKVLDSGFFSISPKGDMNLCPFMEPIGNIINSRLKELWYSEKAEEIRAKMSLCKKGCHHLINCWYE